MKRIWMIAGVPPLLAVGCGDPWQDEPLNRVCDDVGYAVAAVAFSCTASEEQATAAFQRFEERYRCRVREIHTEDPYDDYAVPFEVYYTCPAAVGDVSCAHYARYTADDFARMDDWFGVAPACATILAPADGGRLPLEEP